MPRPSGIERPARESRDQVERPLSFRVEVVALPGKKVGRGGPAFDPWQVEHDELHDGRQQQHGHGLVGISPNDVAMA